MARPHVRLRRRRGREAAALLALVSAAAWGGATAQMACSHLTLTGQTCDTATGRLTKDAALASSYSDNIGVTPVKVRGIRITAAAPNSVASYYVRFGVHANALAQPLYGAGLFPSGLTCTGFTGCDSYAEDLGTYAANDVVEVTADASGTVTLSKNGVVLKTEATGIDAYFAKILIYTPSAYVLGVGILYSTAGATGDRFGRATAMDSARAPGTDARARRNAR